MADLETSGSPGAFAYEGLDRVLHEKARLGIVTALAANSEGRPFTEIKDLCALTDGNLNRHLKVLADAGIVSIRKRLGRGRAETVVRLSATGRRAFAAYLDELEQVLRDARPQLGEAGLRRPAPG